MSCLLREQKNHLLVVLVSIQVCLLLLSILVVSGQSLTLNGLIVISTSLILKFLLPDMYGNIFSVVIILSPLIPSMLIYIFLLLNIIIFYDLFGKICHISGKCSLFELATAPGVFTAIPEPILFFAITRVSVLYIKMNSWS